ncbi:MAG TPA: aldehyde dehydrogenase family protein [Sedimenticola thiotaurini]|uniref:Aldehyde dehydrogenase family protein n=1 Tax=Sedimenticola thiotaurini TaxID=1543721 RepID=A0A831W4B0_9GAMM|nr:aldehyde dehydrogenase family protein [Sedimenticola thiotaurini]
MSESLTTISPVDGSVYVERPWATPARIDAALDLARDARRAWRDTPLQERQAICSRMVDAFVAHRDGIAAEICWQMGRPIRFAGGEVNGLEERARTMIRLADEGLAPVRPPQKEGFRRWIQREPVGTVFVIAPWNYPYLTAINAVMPAILAGNAVVLKHSAQTPLCAERLQQAFDQAGLPEGVFQYLHLTHADTEQVIRDGRVDHVAFTGSVPGGRMVERVAAGRFIGVGLELGGKDPAYIRADADLEQAVETALDGAFFNSGQSCCGIERIYVHQSVYDRFLEQAVAWVAALKLGRPDDPDTTLGPVVRAAAADFVRGQVDEALAAGAVAHIDPADYPLDRPGSPYLAPQLLTGVDHSMRVMTEESFGPVVGVQKVASDEEAVALMNDSVYGLTAALFTRDYDRGIELGQRLEAGTFFINRCDYLDPELAWTGVKESGRGCTLSVLGFEAFTRPKSFHIKTAI